MYYHFGGGAALYLTPYRYLFIIKEGQYCLGIFDNGNAGTLVGGINVRNVLVQVRTGALATGTGVGQGLRSGYCYVFDSGNSARSWATCWCRCRQRVAGLRWATACPLRLR